MTSNRVHDNDHIGIAFTGFEETCPDPTQDRARDGVCRGNVVWNLSTGRNPSYRGEFAADGIDCSDCILRDNVIRHSRVTDLGLGGYDAQRGATLRCRVTNNTFYQNDTRRTGSGGVAIDGATRGAAPASILARTNSRRVSRPSRRRRRLVAKAAPIRSAG